LRVAVSRTLSLIDFGPGAFNPGASMGSRPKARTTVVSVKVSDSKGTMRLESTYDRPDSARQVDDDVRRNPGQNRNALYEMESHQVSRSGSIVTFRRTGPVKKRKGFMPFGI
jgi:hypothetical protein